MGLLATGQITLETVLNHELEPVPPSMFSKEGDVLIDSHIEARLQGQASSGCVIQVTLEYFCEYHSQMCYLVDP